MLSSLRDDEREKVFSAFPSPMPQMTDLSINDLDVLRGEVELVKRQGFALDAEETTPGIVCVAVPLSAEQTLDDVYAVSASILRTQATAEKVDATVDLLRALAARTAAR
jgi:DNA-binding IclR family transcriptional regulator